MAETQLVAPQGTFVVERLHASQGSPLRAWSAADLLLLEHLGADAGGEQELGRVLIVNDEFGALTTALSSHAPTAWSDSALSRQATEQNLARNGLAMLSGDQNVSGEQLPEGTFDTVIVHVPKTSALLEYQLRVIRSVTNESSRVIGAGMVRHIHTSTLAIFETQLGQTATSLAKRKARLIHSQVSVPLEPPRPQGSEFTTADGSIVCELPGTFSAGHVDVGTALLIEVLTSAPAPSAGAVVADLGCGNGIVAVAAAKLWPDCSFLLFDASYLAIAAAQQTWQRNQVASAMNAMAVDGFGDASDASIDLVVTNPPFHQGHALDKDLTAHLLGEMARVLTVDGAGYVVVQRHLNLHITMKRWFESIQVLSKHPTHVVIEAKSPRR